MGKKITIDNVRLIAEENGHELLSNHYKNYQTIIKFKCICGQTDQKKYRDYRTTPKCTFKNHNELLKTKEISESEDSYETSDNSDFESEDSDFCMENFHNETQKWIQKSNEMYGEGNINYRYLETNKFYNNREKFKLKCIKCNSKWITNTRTLIVEKNGCPWCRNRCWKYTKNDLYTIKIIGKC